GNDKYTTEVVLERFNGTLVMLGERGERGGGSSGGGGSDWNQDSAPRGNFGGGGGSSSGGGGGGRPAAFDSDLDDDVPF
ncbi:MAG: ssb, partial [Sphingomonadales bacterium]|nr:ssb [Sphingomonadales bacterium]